MALLSRILADREGSVLVLGALSLTGVIGASALAVEAGQGYMTKVSNQRVADTAALAAALSYNGGATLAAAQATARDVVRASGLDSSTAVVTPDSTAAPTLIAVTVTTPVQVRLGRVLTSTPSFNVANVAKASLIGKASPGCIVALSTAGVAAQPSAGRYGVVLTGGTRITSSSCDLVTNSGVSVPSGTFITAHGVTAGKKVDDQAAQWNQPGVTGTVNQNVSGAAKDVVGTDARVAAGLAKVGGYTAPAANANPSTPGGVDWAFNYSYPDAVKAYKTGNGTYVVPKGNYAIKALTVAGGVSVTFQPGSTVTISGGINNGGALLALGDGTYAINGGITSGSSGISFGNSKVTIGAGTLSFTGTNSFGNGDVSMNGVLSLAGGANLTFGTGAHSFNGIAVSGGAKLTIGAGSLNVTNALTDDGGGSTIKIGAGPVAIGRDASGRSVNVSGGSTLTFADGAWSANGNVATSGGSQLTFGAAASHYINGSLDLNGTSTFGAGAFYVNGGFTNNSGGSMTGTGATFFLAGTFTLNGGTSLTLTAPTTDSGGGVTDLLVATKTTGSTKLGGGSQDSYAGLVYAPNSALNMDGGAAATGGGRCFMLVVATIEMNGGTSLSTACATIGNGGGTTGTVALLQ